MNKHPKYNQNIPVSSMTFFACKCVCSCLYGSMREHVGEGQKLMLALYLDHCLLYLSRQGISLGLESGDLASLASQLGLGKS